MSRRLSPLGLLVLLLAIEACRSSNRPADVPGVIFVPTSARELRVRTGAGTGQVDVSYLAAERYPASALRGSLALTLRNGGYEPLDHDFLDPGRPLEVPRAWWSSAERQGGSERCLWDVVEDWKNSRGDVVRVSLRYDQPCDPGPVRRGQPATAAVRISAALLPADTARAMSDAARTLRPPQD